MNIVINNRNSILSTGKFVSLLKGLSLFFILCSVFINRAEAQISFTYNYQQDTIEVYAKPQVEVIENMLHHGDDPLNSDSLQLIFTGEPPFFITYDTNFFNLPDAFGAGYYPINFVGYDPVTCIPQYMAVVNADLEYYHYNYDLHDPLSMAESHIDDTHLGISLLWDSHCSNEDAFVAIQVMCEMEHEEDLWLPFDEYVITKWCNTFMLNKNLLDAMGILLNPNGIAERFYCVWYENGVVLDTGDFYTYGNNGNDIFVEGNTYSFVLITTSGRIIHSTEKIFHCNEDDINIYPNPVASNSEMIIDLGSLFIGETVKINIVDMWGRVLKSFEAASSKIVIPASFARGSYVLQVKDVKHKFIVY
jgi:hypothetical protein